MGIENLLLLNCRSSYLDSDKVYPPLGLLYLHQKLINERPNINVKVTDEYNLKNSEWLKGFDAIGVSIMTPQREESNKILNFIKKHTPETLTWAGGPHVRHYLGEMSDKWDNLITHDGERAILDLVDGKAKKVITDQIHPREFKDFFVKPARLENEEFLKTFNYKLKGRNSTTMLTAQGCSENCSFCEDAGSFVRYTPFNQIIEELDDIQNMGFGGVYIFDDIFSLIQKRTEPIAREMKKRDLIYRCNGQARLFNENFADMLKETGCVEIAFGAESGSQKILDNVNKRTTVEMNYDFVRLCNEREISCKAFLMLGLPGETRQTIKETEDFIKYSGIEDFQLAVYYPYKGTKIRDDIDKGNNLVDLTFEGEGLGAYGQKGGSTEAVVRTSELSTQDLLSERDRLVEQYHPKSHKKKWGFFETWEQNI